VCIVLCVDGENSQSEMLYILGVMLVKLKEGNVGFDISVEV
jgi:hypothetical protein